MFTAFIALTIAGLQSSWSPVLVGWRDIPFPPIVVQNLTTPRQVAGAHVFQDHGCNALGTLGGQTGPNLSNIGAKYETQYLVLTILRWRANMPAYAGTIGRQDLANLVAFPETPRYPPPTGWVGGSRPGARRVARGGRPHPGHEIRQAPTTRRRS